MSPFKNKFLRVAGAAVAAATVLTAPTVIAENMPSPASPSTNGPPLAPDVYISMVTPLYPEDTYNAWLKNAELSLLSTPDYMIKITADNAQETVRQIVAGVKESIIKDDSPVNRIVLAGDGTTNGISAPMPNEDCHGVIPYLQPAATFCAVPVTDVLTGLVDLQAEEFPGHKAGEPLAQAIDINSCDIFDTMSAKERFPSREFSQLAAQLNMPIIASTTEIGYGITKPRQVSGDFWALLPDGNVAELPGMPPQFNQDLNQTEAWIQQDGFKVQLIGEPVPGYPFSVVNTTALTNKPAHFNI